MKNHQEKQVVENLLRGELLRRTLPYLEASLLGRLYSEMQGAHNNKALHKALGNSMATNVMRHISDRIELVNKLLK
jgi:hypothetical protein